ncbi:hypothetical protein C7B76_23395 [filamentous cyanobacterium CCP2]|nr:hypothetical protein C7B76_23395 [filamentous cyanobacterium CCP2]
MVSCSWRVWILAMSLGSIVLWGFAQSAGATPLCGSLLDVIGQASHQPQSTSFVSLNYLVYRILVPAAYAMLILWIILLIQGKER